MATLSRSKEDYLKALYTLGSSRAAVAPSRLAIQLGVSAPSVTNMLARLVAERLVTHAPQTGARLTQRGRRRALEIVRRHRILEAFLVSVLGLDWSEVHADAEVLEHHVSDRVLDAIDRLMGHPQEDPHGHPIPDARGRVRRRPLVALVTLRPGAAAVVREIHDADERRMARWKETGLVPGAKVKVRDVRPVDDVFELEVEGRTMLTGSEGLEGVMVEARSGEAHVRAS